MELRTDDMTLSQASMHTVICRLMRILHVERMFWKYIYSCFGPKRRGFAACMYF
jgi:hypothetical protein